MRTFSFLTQSIAAFAVVVGLSLSASAQTTVVDLINDNFTDGDPAVTGDGSPAESAFFTTSSSAALNSSSAGGGVLDFATGPSGRAIHTNFAPTTLSTVGDRIDVSFSFTTPADVQVGGSDEEIRFGLFDSSTGAANLFTGVNRTAGAAGTDTLTPIDFEANIASGSTNNQPGLDLAGFTAEFDVEGDPDDDIQFRISDVNNVTGQETLGPSGRLLTTTLGLPDLSSGADFGTSGIVGSTDYIGTLSVELIGTDTFEITSTISGGNFVAGAAGTTHSDTISLLDDLSDPADPIPGLNTSTFDFFGIGVGGNAFGISSVVGEANNGLDFTNVTITATTSVPEPSSVALLGLLGCAGFVRRRR